MAKEANCAKICTFFCFNIFFLISAVYYVIKIIQTLLQKKYFDFDLGASHGKATTLLSLLIVFMIFIVIFGFFVYCVDKPVLYLAVSLSR